jgi:SAM-dependent methyltransferase
MSSDLHTQTRAVYHDQHERVANDPATMERFIDMFSAEYFGLERPFWEGAKAIDVGCGNTGKMLIALHKLGVRDITGTDLGEDFIEPTQKVLRKHGATNIKLVPGNALNLPFQDDEFDFAACHGVLIHLANMDEVRQAFAELARITKRNGWLYTVFGCVGGLMEDCLVPALRNYYRDNQDFRRAIDNLEPELFHQALSLSVKGVEQFEGERVDLSAVANLLDVDLCVTIQNLIQTPIRLPIDQQMIKEMYAANGFGQPRRLKRYVKRKNIRRFLAPHHYAMGETTISKLLYGSGNLEFIAQKK